MAVNKIMSHMSGDHGSWATNDGNHNMVSNLTKMISIIYISDKSECLNVRTMRC
jgi:hypothetical protein